MDGPRKGSDSSCLMNYNVNMKIYVGSQVHQFSCYLHLRIKKVLDFNARSVILLKEIINGKSVKIL